MIDVDVKLISTSRKLSQILSMKENKFVNTQCFEYLLQCNLRDEIMSGILPDLTTHQRIIITYIVVNFGTALRNWKYNCVNCPLNRFSERKIEFMTVIFARIYNNTRFLFSCSFWTVSCENYTVFKRMVEDSSEQKSDYRSLFSRSIVMFASQRFLIDPLPSITN